MPSSSGSQDPLVRFGEFVADLQAGELRKVGSNTRLTGQPFQVLVVLLDRPGRMVTREELHRRLWPADTFVDFEHGLNAAVNRLREALGDSADSPSFIETLPRRGYRFIAPVSRTSEPLGGEASQHSTTEKTDRDPKVKRTNRWITLRYAVAAVGLAIVITAAAFLVHRRVSDWFPSKTSLRNCSQRLHSAAGFHGMLWHLVSRSLRS